jgi:hypothetical protein
MFNSRFDLSEIQDQKRFLFRVPTDLDQFMYDYDHSKFVECDCDLARNATNKQDYGKNSKAMSLLAYVVDYLHSIQKHFFLFGGSLIGWYRECGIIPFTSDLDIGMLAIEYESKIKQHFKKNQKALLVLVFGMRNMLYELRFEGYSTTIDLFILDSMNETHIMSGYHSYKNRHM